MKIVFFGSSLVSAYWNGAATYYRGILRVLFERGHEITFYEPDAWEGLEQFFTPGEKFSLPIPPMKYCAIFKKPPTAKLRQWASARVLAEHNAAHRATELESYVAELLA